jgi:hypothetical protein
MGACDRRGRAICLHELQVISASLSRALRVVQGPFFPLIFLTLVLQGCASFAPQYYKQIKPSEAVSDLPLQKEILGLPFFPNDDLFCGPAAVSMVFTHLGQQVTLEEIAETLFIPGRLGTIQLDMLAVSRERGLTTYVIEPNVESLLREVAAGRPVIVLENYGFSWMPIWHYATVTGYDLSKNAVIRKSGIRERSVTPIWIFENLWKKEGYWGFVMLRPGESPVNPNPDRWFLELAESERYWSSEEKETAWKKYLSVFPNNALGHAALGNVAFNSGDIDRAIAYYKMALDLDPNNRQINELAQIVFSYLDEKL